MKNSLLRKLLIQIFLLMGIFSLMRLVFVYHNRDIQPIGESLWENAVIAFWGLRYDFFSTLIFLSPVFMISIITYLINNNKIKKKLFQAETLLYFSIIFIITAIMVIDVAYFRFNGRRATVEVFGLINHSRSAFLSFLKGYSELLVTFFLVMAGLVFFYKRLIGKQELSLSSKQWISAGVAFLLLFFFGIGSKKRPLQPKTATYYVSSKHSTIVTNTPLTLLYSIYKKQKVLPPKEYMSETEARKLVPIFHNFKGDSFQKKNIVVFILESFSREYLVDGHINRAVTPFLDSLMSKSIVFENAYANATTSSYGIMCILGGLPAFMDEPYFSSIYSQNKFLGIGDILKKEGYTNSFFFGAEDDHYGFRKKMALLGIENYYSQESLPDFEKFYDGDWGIYDHVYFAFAAEELKKQPKPFFSTIFNISSHYPYNIPPNIKENLAEERIAPLQSITYVDFSLKKFFKKIEKESWYNETVFFFISDHWAKVPGIIENTMVGKYQIPAFMFIPGSDKQTLVQELFQQLDIIPTLLDTLNYKGKVMSFGKSIFNPNVKYRYTINEFENIYQIIDNEFVLTYNERLEKPVSLYNHKNDRTLSLNLLKENPEQVTFMEKYLKANIQMYNNSLIENKLHP